VQDSKQCSSIPLHPYGRCGIPSRHSFVKASSVWTTRTFCPDVPLCLEASNCSRLHPSRRLSNTSRRLSMFDKLNDFFPKHRYGKTAATVRKTWLFRLDAILDKASRAEEVQPSRRQTPWFGCSGLNMKIACSKSATVRTLRQHRPNTALFKKEFQGNLKSRLHSCPFRRPQLPSGRRLGK
jgi:hypothetical protein